MGVNGLVAETVAVCSSRSETTPIGSELAWHRRAARRRPVWRRPRRRGARHAASPPSLTEGASRGPRRPPSSTSKAVRADTRPPIEPVSLIRRQPVAFGVLPSGQSDATQLAEFHGRRRLQGQHLRTRMMPGTGVTAATGHQESGVAPAGIGICQQRDCLHQLLYD